MILVQNTTTHLFTFPVYVWSDCPSVNENRSMQEIHCVSLEQGRPAPLFDMVYLVMLNLSNHKGFYILSLFDLSRTGHAFNVFYSQCYIKLIMFHALNSWTNGRANQTNPSLKSWNIFLFNADISDFAIIINLPNELNAKWSPRPYLLPTDEYPICTDRSDRINLYHYHHSSDRRKEEDMEMSCSVYTAYTQ